MLISYPGLEYRMRFPQQPGRKARSVPAQFEPAVNPHFGRQRKISQVKRLIVLPREPRKDKIQANALDAAAALS